MLETLGREELNNILQDGDILSKWSNNHRLLYKQIQDEVDRTGNIKCLLPLLFRFNGKPVTLDNHFMFEINFYLRRPRRVIKKCGRQVGKSFQNALELILRGITIPNWNILYLTPLQEQAQRFSQQYVAALIEESPARRLMTLKGASSRVFQRTLGNRSELFFSYAQRDANRARGINANEVGYDEMQLMQRDVIPVLQQVMGASPYGEYETMAGTPLSYGNILNEYWHKSTMSEWMIPCRHCGHNNIATVDADLIKMIGPVNDDIAPGYTDADGRYHTGTPGLVCAKCSPHNSVKNLKHIYTEDGRWYHRDPAKRDDFLGIHVPQPITTIHSYSRDRWIKLNNRLEAGNAGEIYNEILGEACDAGFKPITESDLKRAACLSHKNDVNNMSDAYTASRRYDRLAMGIDWGGGGLDGISRTKAAIVGLTSTGKTDVIFGIDLAMSHRPQSEVNVLMALAEKFGCQIIAHDVGGGVGSTRESMMYQTGSLSSRIWPICYTGPMTSTMLNLRQGNRPNETPTWVLDKSKSLTYHCQAIKQGHIRFFQYDYISSDRPGLLHDYLSLITDISHNPNTSDRLVVDREDGLSDDFVHACNFACIALWSTHKAYPKLSIDLMASEVFENKQAYDIVRNAKSMSIDEIQQICKSMMFSLSV